MAKVQEKNSYIIQLDHTGSANQLSRNKLPSLSNITGVLKTEGKNFVWVHSTYQYPEARTKWCDQYLNKHLWWLQNWVIYNRNRIKINSTIFLRYNSNLQAPAGFNDAVIEHRIYVLIIYSPMDAGNTTSWLGGTVVSPCVTICVTYFNVSTVYYEVP